MFRFLVVLIILVPQISAAALLNAAQYKRASCQLKIQDETKQKVEKNLMLLQIDEGFGRFGQIDFVYGQTVLRYQILIEDEPAVPGANLILQTLLVGESFSSSEFSAQEASSVSLKNGDYTIACLLYRNP